jgi:hypothetical protein
MFSGPDRALAAFVFLIAAVAFAFLDWPGLPT